MIRNITIQGYKSFHPTKPTNISLETETQKPVFFYGLNGAGKTAIGEVIQSCDTDDPRFQTCHVHPTKGGPFRYLVYNQDFVRSVIGEAEGMPGIFTIGELDTETQKQINEYERLLKEARDERNRIEAELTRTNDKLTAAFNDAKDQIWEVYKKHDKGMFDDFLTGYGSNKKKFFEDLRKYEISDSYELESLDSLAKRFVDISGDKAPKKSHSLPLDVFASIEQDGIWQERLTVSHESRLAPMLEKLGHGDWVTKGRNYVKDDQCPFCQQELPHDFLSELVKLFDGDHQEKIRLIDSYIADYETAIQNL